MEELKEIIINNVNVEDLTTYEEITENLNEYINEQITEIEINDNKYYIIKLTCEHCDKEYYFLSIDNDLEYIENNEEFENDFNYGSICKNCVDEHFYHCECCGELVHEDDYYYFNDEIYCKECYNENITTCDCCGCEISINDTIHTEIGNEICDNCYGEEYFTCDNCGGVYHVDDMNEHNDNYYCEECYEELKETECMFDYYNTTNRNSLEIDKPLNEYEEENAVCDYHENPIDFEKRAKDGETTNLYFGVELEITNKHNNTAQASHFVANNLHCRIENDSSIPYYGFEIISDPATLEFWKYRKEKIKQVFEELINNGYISHNADDCGLHIHASREGLGDTKEEQEKIIENIILICENFKQELKTFSRRGDFNWCHFFKEDGETKETNIKKIKEQKGNKGRYQVINTTNRNTIEFRINRGTLNINTFFASLELFNNIIELAKSGDFIGKTWKYLINLNNFDELIKYNKERNIKSYVRIKETSEQEEKEQEREYKRIIKQEEINKKLIKSMQEFKFDILKKYEDYDRIIKSDLYYCCMNTGDQTNIRMLKENLISELSSYNSYINESKKHFEYKETFIEYHEITAEKVNDYKTRIKNTFISLQNIDAFRYIFKNEKIEEKTEKSVNIDIDLTGANTYESIVILKPLENLNNDKTEIENKIKSFGIIENIDEIGLKNLAYEIQGHRQGHYIVFTFKSKAENIEILERYYRNIENILKFITIKKED